MTEREEELRMEDRTSASLHWEPDNVRIAMGFESYCAKINCLDGDAEYRIENWKGTWRFWRDTRHPLLPKFSGVSPVLEDAKRACEAETAMLRRADTWLAHIRKNDPPR